MTAEYAIIPTSKEHPCPLKTHPMQTHSKSGTIQLRTNPTLLLALAEPKCQRNCFVRSKVVCC